MKTCPKCSTEKAEECFSKGASRYDGLYWQCKACHAAYAALHSERDKIKRREFLYSLTEEKYQALLAAQGGLCAICCKSLDQVRSCVDHDHTCCPGGKSCGDCVRQILCDKCNVGLGSFGDNPSLLASAIEYLIRHGGKP